MQPLQYHPNSAPETLLSFTGIYWWNDHKVLVCLSGFFVGDSEVFL